MHFLKNARIHLTPASWWDGQKVNQLFNHLGNCQFDRQTDRWAEGWMDREHENIMSPAPKGGSIKTCQFVSHVNKHSYSSCYSQQSEDFLASNSIKFQSPMVLCAFCGIGGIWHGLFIYWLADQWQTMYAIGNSTCNHDGNGHLPSFQCKDTVQYHCNQPPPFFLLKWFNLN